MNVTGTPRRCLVRGHYVAVATLPVGRAARSHSEEAVHLAEHGLQDTR
jgi:hypothetical protein